MRAPLFFIALLPDEHLQKEVTAVKNYCAEHFQASHSLTSPPHITLVPPFSWNNTNLKSLCDAIDGFTEGQNSFEVCLNGFNSFPPRVIFVDVEPNPTLAKLAVDLNTHLEQTVGLKRESSHGFNPHMTIAHRDLQRHIFPKAWAYFQQKTFKRQFKAEEICLLRHEKGRWEIEQVFGLG